MLNLNLVVKVVSTIAIKINKARLKLINSSIIVRTFMNFAMDVIKVKLQLRLPCS